MPPNPKREIVRTRSGCWTCRARKKKCDEGRPSCLTCQKLSLVCEGYGLRLKWSGRAKPAVTFNRRTGGNRENRERIQKARKQRAGSSPASSPQSPQSDISINSRDAVLMQYLSQDLFDSLSHIEREALYNFADWGAATLVSTTAPVPDDRFEALGFFGLSKSLLLNSITYQMTLEAKYAAYVDEYYGRSIALFRQTLCDPKVLSDEMAPYAGILLSTISTQRAMPYTVHLNGLAGIFMQEGIFDPNSEEDSEFAALIGILELPTHILGRQTTNLHLWYQYCLQKEGVEELTGLPCSLLHLLASSLDTDIEERLPQWTHEESDPVVGQIWNASHHAGMIMVRELRKDQGFPVSHGEQSVATSVRQIMIIIRELRRLLDTNAPIHRSGLFFPLIAAGSQLKFLTLEDRSTIKECLGLLSNVSAANHVFFNATMTVLETLWASDGTRSIHQVARDLGLELCLI